MTNILLFIIVLILLFGASAVLGAISIIFWVIAIIAGIILVVKIIRDDLKEAAEKQRRRHLGNEVRKERDEVERIQYELEHPGRTRKKWFGLYVESEKKQGTFTESSLFYLLVVTGGLVGLFFLAILAIIIAVIIKMFSSDTTIPANSSNNQNGYNPTYSYSELKKIGE